MNINNQQVYLVIDIGTGNVRVAVAASSGTILSIERENIQYEKDEHYPEALNFDPDVLWDQILRLTTKALEKAPGVTITAVTATSQREGIVLVSADGRSLIGLPNIDHRGREWEHIIKDTDRIYQLTGRYPTSLFSALKVVGIRNRRPDVWNSFATFMSISDWVEYKLSGVLHYEHSQASETLLYSVPDKKWSAELCGVFDLDIKQLPPLTLSGTIIGHILPERAAELNIAASAVVIVGGADTQLAIKSTENESNDVVIVSGTTTPIVKVMDSYVTDAKQRTWTGRHTNEASFIFEANAGVTGLNYQRLKEVFYPNESYEVIEAEVSAVTHFQCMASLGSLLADEKTPLTKGGFIFDAPVSHLLTRGSFVWATLWDIACSILENYKSLCDVTPHDKDYIWACGGGVQSLALRQFIANLLDKKIIVRDSYRQASVIGGVYICNEALGLPKSQNAILETVYPQKQEHYAALYDEWKKTRASFKALF